MAGLLTFGSTYSPHLPGSLDNEPVATCGFCPRIQRRVRTGFTPVSLLSLKLFINYHLLPDSCVANRFKILTYYRARSVFEPVCALLSNKIWQFQNSFL